MTTHNNWLRRAAWAAALALTVPCAAQTTAPATGAPEPAPAAAAPATPATVTAASPATTHVTADYSTPAATVQTMLTAINQGDFVTARAALDIPAAHADDVDALLGTMEATSKLQRAAGAKYLSAGDKAFGTPTPATLSTQLKQVTSAEVVTRNNDATLTMPADPASNVNGGEVKLKKIGGDWKIDAAVFFKLDADPAGTTTRVVLAKKIIAISQAMAGEIAANKYFSAADAYVEYWNRCQAAAK